MNTRFLMCIVLFATGCIEAKWQKARSCANSTNVACDPVNQGSEAAGEAKNACCWETEACQINGFTGKPECVLREKKDAPTAAKLGEICSFENAYTASQTDNCQPGLACLTYQRGGGEDKNLCMQLCNSYLDCTGACTERRGIDAKNQIPVNVCDPLPVIECGVGGSACCSPILDAPANGCAFGQVCRLVGLDDVNQSNISVNSRTRCDYTTGDGGACTADWNCKLFQFCLKQPGASQGICRETCVPNSTNDIERCSNGECIAQGAQFGYCSI